jgi:hypothetical protein
MIGFINTFLITINLQPNASSLTAEDSLHSHSDSVLYCLHSLEAEPYTIHKQNKKLRGLSPQANYTDRLSDRRPLVGEVSANFSG